MIEKRGSAEMLETCELVALAEWICEPPDNAEGRARREKFLQLVAIPLVRELGARLQRSLDSQRVEMPEVLGKVAAMRKAQREYWASNRKSKETRESLLALSLAAEREVDAMIDSHLRPRLFAEEPG